MAKLPQIQYSQAAQAQSRGPVDAVIEYQAKQRVLQTGFGVAADIAKEKEAHDIAGADAAQQAILDQLETEKVGKDQFTANELKAYGVTEANTGIQWNDAEGKPTLIFKTYEIEAALTDQVLEDSAIKIAGSISSPKARAAWIDGARLANQQQVINTARGAQKKAKDFEYRSAIASLDALANSPRAQLSFAKSSPALKDRPEVRQKYIDNAQVAIYSTEVNATINNGTDKDLERQLDSMKDPESRAKIPASEKQIRILQTRTQSEIDRRQRDRDLAEGKAIKLSKEQEAERNKLAKEAISDYSKAKNIGMAVSDETQLEVEGLVSGTVYQEQYDLLNDVEEFAVLSAADRRDEMNSINTGNLTEVDRYEAYLKSSIALRDEAEKDGYELGVKQGIVDYEPIELGNPDSVKLRQDQVRALSEHYGVPVATYTTREVGAYSDQLNQMTVDEQVAMTATFSPTPEVWEQFAKSGQQVFAWVGASGDGQLAATALAGQKKIDQKIVIPPSKNEYLLASNEYLGNVYGTENKAAVMETAIAIYAETAPVGDDGVFDADAWQSALELTTGGMGEVNGSKVLVPRGTDEDTMQEYVDTFSADRVAAFGGVSGLTNDAATELIQNSTWVSVGEGEYQVNVGNKTLLNNKLEPFTITYNSDTAMDQRAMSYAEKYKKRPMPTGRDEVSPFAR